jgi:serine protease
VTDDKAASHSHTQGVAVTDGSSSNELQSGVPVSNLTGAKDPELDYFINTTENDSKVAVNINGGSGDADLYVQKGAAPSKTLHDCRPYQSGNNESCTVAVTGGDEVHIGLQAYSTFSGVTLDVK